MKNKSSNHQADIKNPNKGTNGSNTTFEKIKVIVENSLIRTSKKVKDKLCIKQAGFARLLLYF